MNTHAVMPAVYLPHGGGPAFFMAGGMGQMFRPMGQFLASVPTLLPTQPRAILVATAHWEAPEICFCSGEDPALIYDYRCFPKETYAITYPAPGAPEWAAKATKLLRDAGIESRVDPTHGWDHGVFIPLKVMFPQADIPVLAMSLKAGLSPSHHVAVAEALRPLRGEGVLIMGSGMSYHNLRQMNDSVAAADFDRWLDGALTGDAEHRRSWLTQWTRAPAARDAHPREEHLLPLMVASGAGSNAPGRKIWGGAVGATAVSAWAFD